MAQIVKFWDNNIEYKNGPFVIVEVTSGMFRVHAECDNLNHPVMINGSIRDFMKKNTPVEFTEEKDHLNKLHLFCDWLNKQWMLGKFEKKNGVLVSMEYF